jgi:hypothetical protein
MSRILPFFALLVFFLSLSLAAARLREGECEVCLANIRQFQQELASESSAEKIESGIRRICKAKNDRADKRFCYYIGGSDDSATSLLRSISGPIKNALPSELICEKLKKADGQICAVRYEKPKEPVDYSKLDFTKLRVKELKDILSEWGEKCERCSEKQEYLDLIKKVMPKHVKPAEAAATKEL